MAKVYVTALVHAPLEDVWQVVRDFNGLPNWHPFVQSSRIEEGRPGDAVGCVRNFDLKDGGGRIREQLLALSDHDHSCTYSILESPLPVADYVATLRWIPITEGRQSLGEWQAQFEVAPDTEDEAVELVRGIFREGLIHLDRLMASL